MTIGQLRALAEVRGIPVVRVVIAPAPAIAPTAWGVRYEVDDPQGILTSVDLYSDNPPRDPWGNIDADALYVNLGIHLRAPGIAWTPDIAQQLAAGDRPARFLAGVRAVLASPRIEPRDGAPAASSRVERVAVFARGEGKMPGVLRTAPQSALAYLLQLLDLRHTLLVVTQPSDAAA